VSHQPPWRGDAGRYYTKYNSLTDTKKFLMKEISVLDSMFTNYPKAMEGAAEGKDRFLDSIDAIKKVCCCMARCHHGMWFTMAWGLCGRRRRRVWATT